MITTIEDRRDLFPLYVRAANSIQPTSRSSRYRQRRAKRVAVEQSVRNMSVGLNALNDADDRYYHAALVKPDMDSCRRERKLAVQERVLEYMQARSREAWSRGLLSPRESAEWSRFGSNAPMVRDDKTPIPLDPDGDRIGLPPPGLAASVPILDVLPAKLRSYYAGNECVREPAPEEVAATRRCIMVKHGAYPRLGAKLVAVGLVELVDEEPKEINGLFGVPKDGGAKQRLILDARRANLHFADPDDPEMPHPGLLPFLDMGDQQGLWIRKIDIDNFYHRLKLPKHLRTYFGLPPLYYEKQRVWPVFERFRWGGLTLS
ncbi:MAG: hypothetical protein AAF438_09045 [Pseudomonadota bacterium]